MDTLSTVLRRIMPADQGEAEAYHEKIKANTSAPVYPEIYYRPVAKCDLMVSTFGSKNKSIFNTSEE